MFFYFISASIFEALGIDWQSMLFHLSAIIILAVGLTFLLYKPVKKIISGHNQKIDEIFAENEKLQNESDELKQKYQGMMDEAKQTAHNISVEASQKAEQRASVIVAAAEEQAKNILAEARSEAKAEKQRLLVDFDKNVSKAAVEIAGKVLMREVNEKDNKKLIDACLSDWEK